MICACGQPLHYTDPSIEATMKRLVEERGEYITVNVVGTKYKVQRHYIALHGIRGVDLPDLLEQGIVEAV